ncbi:MAG: MmcQ/YjbR family DNA-binding protein [Pseudomonadota bacterium]
MATKNPAFDVVRAVALGLPEIADSSSPRCFAVKYRGKLLACEAIHKSAESESLMVRIDFDKREQLISLEPDIYYLLPHYAKYPCVLVRLAKIDRESLRLLLIDACRFIKPETTTKRRKKA